MVIIEKEKIKDMYFLNLMYEIHKISEKIRLFQIRYKMNFQKYQKKIKKNKNEIYTEWEDYMEWKACMNMKKKYDIEKKEIENGNFKMS